MKTDSNESFSHKFMIKLANMIYNHKIKIIIIWVVIFILSIISGSLVEVKTNFKDLLPEDNPRAKKFTEIIDEFKSASTLMVVIQGEERKKYDFFYGRS